MSDKYILISAKLLYNERYRNGRGGRAANEFYRN